MAGLYQAAVSFLNTKKQIASYTLILNGQQYDTASAVFDPTLDESSASSTPSILSLKLDQKTINLILALVAGLFLLGLGFYKLARIR
ncbi:MAG: hypothetical protein UX60_C0033G0004 [Berkelbacteria bacterium GW2011_GWA2_46_7]|uniref:Uncharacterized protein n=1 Tax=Berkelbacteria bacterium GW2011_GWA2_46_7 TaxID=1618335 RepID=A0A0G1SMB1_9BACT|nr:MAG: hypothetical protein UX60_C0033G0004 [Berkelbacteria bacterium GW2011_GWA2_46_7]